MFPEEAGELDHGGDIVQVGFVRAVGIPLMQMKGSLGLVGGAQHELVEPVAEVLRMFEVGLLVGFCTDQARDAVLRKELLSGMVGPYREGVSTSALEECLSWEG